MLVDFRLVVPQRVGWLAQFSSVPQLCLTLQSHGLQHTRLPCPSPTPMACSNSSPLSWWCHPTISSSVIPFSWFQSFPAVGSFPMSQLFTSGGQSIGASASASVSPISSRLISFRMDWLHLFAVQGTLRIYSSSTVQNHQFFSTEPSLWSNSHIHTWLLEKP